MRKLIRLIIISLLSFIFCLDSQVKSKENLAASGSGPAKTDKTTSYPTKSAPGLYMNTSPAFSVTYPADWQIRAPEPQSRFIFMVVSPEKLPALRISVIPNMNAPLESSAMLYISSLSKNGKDIKLIYNNHINLEDGRLAQEAEIEWIDNSELKLNGFFLTAKDDDTWITIILVNNNDKIDEGLKKIAYSIKIKPEEKARTAAIDSSFPAKLVHGLYVNNWPAFSVAYPVNWLEKTPEYNLGYVFKAESSEGLYSLNALCISNINQPLENSTKLYINKISNRGKDVKLISDKKTRLEDGSTAQEAEIEWIDNSELKLNGFFLTAKDDDTWITIILVNNNGKIDEGLKKIAYSLRFKPEENSKTSYKYKIPEQTNDGWQTAHFAEVKLNEKKLNDLIGKIQSGTYINIHSVLIIKNGKLVLEEYFPGQDLRRINTAFTRDDTHGVASVTKSVTSALIGIALDKGIIKGTDEELISFFPEYNKELGTDNKARIKLKHVLSMTAGLDWDESSYLYNDPRNSCWIMAAGSANIISYILSRPIKDQPGTKFTYNSGLSTLLGTIIEKRSSLKIMDFAQKYLFGPLGITEFEWEYYNDATGKLPKADGGLYLRPRDMAKFGYLFLKKGNWNGKQVISSKWIEESTSEHIKLSPKMQTGYGYQWWLYKFEINNKIIEAYSALGHGGQHIFVFPGLDAVIVFTGGNYFQRYTGKMRDSIMINYILPAIMSSK